MDNMFFTTYNEDINRADLPQIAGYLSGNQIVLGQQGIDSALLSVSLQTASLNPTLKSAKDLESLYFTDGIQGVFGPAAWYQIITEQGRKIRLTNLEFEHSTAYLDNIVPITKLAAQGLSIKITTVAPVIQSSSAEDRLAGIVYSITIRNDNDSSFEGVVELCLKGIPYLVSGGKDEWRVSRNEMPVWDETNNAWLYAPIQNIQLVVTSGDRGFRKIAEYPILCNHIKLDSKGEQQIDCVFTFEVKEKGFPHSDAAINHFLDGAIQQTSNYWKNKLGGYQAAWSKHFPEFIFRSALEAFLCTRLNLNGDVVGVAPSPIPIEETPELCDVLFTSLPILYLQPELYQKVIAWYVDYLKNNEINWIVDTRVLVIPAIMMGLGYRTTGRKDLFLQLDDLYHKVDEILKSVDQKKAYIEGLYLTEKIRGHTPLMQIELGTNILCWAAFHFWGILSLNRENAPGHIDWQEKAGQTHAGIQKGMAVRGPGKTGYLLAGLRHGDPTNPMNPLLYYEEDALEIALAPFLGFCLDSTPIWQDTIDYMFSERYALTQKIPDTLLWWERWNHNGLERMEKYTSPSNLSRIVNARKSEVDFDRALLRFTTEIDPCGTIWEMDKEKKRIMRSGRIQGAAFYVFIDRVAGIYIENPEERITILPCTTWRTINCAWSPGSAVPLEMELIYGQDQAAMWIRNKSPRSWKLRLGFRFPMDLVIDRIEVNETPFRDTPELIYYDQEQYICVDIELKAGEDSVIQVSMLRKDLVYKSFPPAQ